MTGTSSARQTCSILDEQTREVDVAFWLQRLLQWIQMERERIRFDHGHRAPAVVDPVAIVELGGAEVGQEQDIRGNIAHAEERRQRGILDRGTLGADTHGAAVSLGSTSQAMVDLPAAFDTPRHAGDEDRRS